MATTGTRPRDVPPDRPDPDDYSPVFAAWALLLTIAVLVLLVAVLWWLRDL
jgi:hypothetical protein